jgi:recombination protein RecA
MAKKQKDELVEEIKQTSKKKIVANIKFIPSGITLLDLVLGGGWPIGTMVNIVGDKSSGKTYLTIESIIHAMKRDWKRKFDWFYDDAEGGFSFDTTTMYGVQIIPDDQVPSTTVEDFAGNLKHQLDNIDEGSLLIYALDSLDGLSSDAERKRDVERQKALEAGKEYEKGTYAMEKQKFMSEFFRLRASELKHKNALLIIISQVRQNINAMMFGEKYVRSGGKALDFYASTILWLAETEKKKKKDRVVGITIKAKTKKAKISAPFRECFLDLIFDYGIDNVGSNISYLYDLKTPQGKEKEGKTKLDWDGQEFTKAKLTTYIEENNLEEELANRVREKWNAIEESISSKGRKNKWK